jgi:hypothetical protein
VYLELGGLHGQIGEVPGNYTKQFWIGDEPHVSTQVSASNNSSSWGRFVQANVPEYHWYLYEGGRSSGSDAPSTGIVAEPQPGAAPASENIAARAAPTGAKSSPQKVAGWSWEALAGYVALVVLGVTLMAVIVRHVPEARSTDPK